MAKDQNAAKAAEELRDFAKRIEARLTPSDGELACGLLKAVAVIAEEAATTIDRVNE